MSCISFNICRTFPQGVRGSYNLTEQGTVNGAVSAEGPSQTQGGCQEQDSCGIGRQTEVERDHKEACQDRVSDQE